MQSIVHYYKSLITSHTTNIIPQNILNFNKPAAIKLSLVTSVFNRCWQLKETLPNNLKIIRNFQDIDIVLVDFGGADTKDIAAMIEQDFCYDLLSGQLKYFQIINPWLKFHMATAKNVAHRLADGDYLFSVDADNYVTLDDLNLILKHFDHFPEGIFHQTIGPAPLSHRQWLRYNLFSSSKDYHDDEVIWDGSCGRIAVSRKRFEMVNGYNENFVGMGMDDIDFLIRSIRTGAVYKHYRLTRPADAVFIDNGSASKDHQHANNENNWSLMDSSLANNVFAPIYVTDSPLERFILYKPAAVLASAKVQVTLFSNVFRADAYIKRFKNDLSDILKGTSNVVIWLLDVVGSHSLEVSTTLRELSQHACVYYFPVNKDPGLYALWNVALRNILSPYTGNLNIDDLRGSGWLPECLSILAAGVADLVSPVTVPFKDQYVSDYATALAALRQNGTYEGWFETRVVLESDDPLSSKTKLIPLVEGEYCHRDLFQVLDEKLSSYCIPNASSIWRRALHGRVGYFDEARYGCIADLALWIFSSAAGFKFRQVSYPALFFISNDQAHRRQVKDDRKLWSLALHFGSKSLQSWATRRCFDLSRIGSTYGDHHFLGWNWVRDQVAKHFVDVPGNLLLDLFIERNFFWNPNPNEKDFYFSRDWLGFIHTTPHQSKVFDQKSQNLIALFAEPRFQRSLPYCRGLIVLSESNRIYLSDYLAKANWQIPVFCLFHPNIPINLSYADSASLEERSKLGSMVFHVGWHLRSFVAFARLGVDKRRKVLLVPKKISQDSFLREVVNKDMVLAGLGPIEEYVEHIYTASNEEYQKILRWGIIFNQYLEPAGSNLISECIMAETPLIINRHPAFEEYLGKDYPLFYDESISPDELLNRLDKPGYRNEVQCHMKKMRDVFSVERFCCELERIGKKVYDLVELDRIGKISSEPKLTIHNVENNISKVHDVSSANSYTSIWEEATHPKSIWPIGDIIHFVVVTPVLNGDKYLEETIKSVLSQSGDFYIDYIVKDGGSRDGTIEIVKKWCNDIQTGTYPLRSKGIRLALYSCPDKGMYDAVAMGLLVRGLQDTDIMTYINADDILTDRSFDLCAGLFTKIPYASWLIGQPNIIDMHGIQLAKTQFPLTYNRYDIADGMHDGRGLYFIQQEGCFWRTRLYKLAGGLDSNLKMAGDYDLWRRFALHAEPLTVNRALGSFRKHTSNLSLQVDKYYQELDSVLSQIYSVHATDNTEKNLIDNRDFGDFFNPDWTAYKDSSCQRLGAVCFINEYNEFNWNFEIVYIKRGWFQW